MKIWNKCLAIFFIICITAPNIFLGNVEINSNIENRTLAEKPQMNLATLSTYPTRYTDYYNDHLPFKKFLVSAYSKIKVKLLNVSTDQAVIIGKDHWLFYDSKYKEENDALADYCGTLNYTQSELEQYAVMLNQMKYECEQNGAQFYFMICPNKESIYGPEYMPEYWVKENRINRTDTLVSYLRENTSINVIYPKEKLLEGKALGQLYFKGDTHWNKLGGFIGYSELQRKIGGKTINADKLRYSAIPAYPGDLSGMLQVSWKDTDYEIDYNYNNSSVKNITDFAESGSILYGTSDSPNKKSILMFRDSFAKAMLDYLAAGFQKSCFIWEPIFNGELISENKPDIVVYEIVERSVPQILRIRHQYTNFDWKEVPDNFPFVIENSGIFFAKESISVENNILDIRGFTFLFDSDSRDTAGKLILSGRKTYEIPVILEERPDVSSYYQTEIAGQYLNSGLYHKIALNNLEPDEYRIFIQLENNGRVACHDTGELIHVE